MTAAQSSAIFALPRRGSNTPDDLARLQQKYAGADSHALLEGVLHSEFPGQIAVSSSFGAEAAVLLKLVADVDPATPVLFIDTGKLFEETLQYKDVVAEQLGLQDIRVFKPLEEQLQAADANGTLWQRDPDYCCHLRKVLPFEVALEPFEAWISGRKSYQSKGRSELSAIELDHDGRIKVNPLAAWSYEDIISSFKALELPRHPLVDKGFPSIGCAPCTRAVEAGEDIRAGRWAGQGKEECGIHKRPALF